MAIPCVHWCEHLDFVRFVWPSLSQHDTESVATFCEACTDHHNEHSLSSVKPIERVESIWPSLSARQRREAANLAEDLHIAGFLKRHADRLARQAEANRTTISN